MTNIAGPGKEISEKTLELNICAEMLQRIRSWPNHHKALWHGMTQRQERGNGLDQLIRNTGQGSSLMLQFKSPWPSSQVDRLYRFSINERQHEALHALANRHPRAVYYVLPLYSTWEKADKHAPDLIRDPWLLPAASIPFHELTSPPKPASGRHRIDVERSKSCITATVHSPVIETGVVNAQEYFEHARRDAQSASIPSNELREWVARWDRIGGSIRFIGLKVLYAPQN